MPTVIVVDDIETVSTLLAFFKIFEGIVFIPFLKVTEVTFDFEPKIWFPYVTELGIVSFLSAGHDANAL